ncbi:hypothetical protein GCM10007391_03140 [Alteromonas halophila]|uniref:Uncharacterized protein n=1 Tax=Alteromonas halophila TaxID=516698 RepID=A0A918JDV0_9ALTE|nr:hypothetical protein GCM10007391_03140 [Alteromonas halophila]
MRCDTKEDATKSIVAQRKFLLIYRLDISVVEPYMLLTVTNAYVNSVVTSVIPHKGQTIHMSDNALSHAINKE